MLSLGNVALKEDVSVPDTVTLGEALQVMHRNGRGVVVVVRDGFPVGILTERDVVRLLAENVDMALSVQSFALKKVLTIRQDRGMESALNMMIDNNVRRMVVTGVRDQFVGVLTQEDIIKFLEDDLYRTNLKIMHILHNGRDIVGVSPDDTLQEVLRVLYENKIGAVPVLEEKKPIGIVTERDILRLATEGTPLHKNVKEFMSAPVYTVREGALVSSVVRSMADRNFRRVIIVDNEHRAVGFITNRDIMRNIQGNYSKLLESKLRFAKDILDSLPEIILEIHEREGDQFVHWGNRRACEVFGEVFMDREVSEFINAQSWRHIHNILVERREIADIKMELSERVYEISASRNTTMMGTVIRLVMKDITDKEHMNRSLELRIQKEIAKRMQHEQLLIQQSKLASMGEMVGAIAHQWRQPLNSLGLIIQDLEDALGFGEVDDDYIRETVLKSMVKINFMSKTIDDFRNFFTPSKTRVPFDVRKSVQDVLFLMSSQITGYQLRIRALDGVSEFSVPQGEGYTTLGYPNEFMQVIMNLLSNAKDAILNRRKMRGDDTCGNIRIGVTQTDDEVSLTVADDGGGVRLEQRDELFQPYFTTKEHGTGIGLYMSKVIVEKNMGGMISVENDEKGAVFHIRLIRSLC